MVTAYWLIGREIVVEIQCGKERAVYGKQVIETLSRQLTKCYDAGFSITNLQYFRKFYQTWPGRLFPTTFMVALSSFDESIETCGSGIS